MQTGGSPIHRGGAPPRCASSTALDFQNDHDSSRIGYDSSEDSVRFDAYAPEVNDHLETKIKTE